jgi:hypothetical protein
MKKIIIGIDVGVNTGVAVWDRDAKQFVEIVTLPILKAFIQIKKYRQEISMVFVEDPRKVVFNTDRKKSQGAGSVKRDAQIWDDFLKMYGIPSTFVRPVKAITKLDTPTFQKMTGYMERTSSHGRDAAMLVFKR